jgi:RimJ/RimL family protein N-acetyltransferase
MRNRPFSAYRTANAPRIVLGALVASDAARMAAYRNDPNVSRYQGWSSCSLEDAQHLIEEMRPRKPGEPGWYQFAVRDMFETLIGDAALFTEFKGAAGKIGFTLETAAQGRGLGKEVVTALVTYAFEECSIGKLAAETDARNVRSAAVLKHAGFALDERHDDVPSKGERITEHVYRLTMSGSAPVLRRPRACARAMR